MKYNPILHIEQTLKQTLDDDLLAIDRKSVSKVFIEMADGSELYCYQKLGVE